MNNFLEDLWYCRMEPDNDFTKGDTVYFEKNNASIESFEKFKESLSEEQLKLYEEYAQAEREFLDYSDKAIFKYAYKLGAQSIMACIDNPKSE